MFRVAVSLISLLFGFFFFSVFILIFITFCLVKLTMDGERGYQSPLMPLSSGQNNDDFCFDYGDYVKPLFVMASGSNENQHGAGSSFQWIQHPNAPRGYVEFLKENNEDAPTAQVLESIGLAVGGSHAIDGTSGIQREVLYHDEGKPFSFRADNCYSVDIGMEKSESPASNSYEALVWKKL